jgi:hypothetical protein
VDLAREEAEVHAVERRVRAEEHSRSMELQ